MLEKNSLENIGSNIHFSALNEQQKKAVAITEGPLLVLAGAGTGKTKVLTSRIANILLKGAFPSQILAVTFTNKASREMTTRVQNIMGARSEGLWLGTFHSISARILRMHAELVGLKSNYTIIDTNDKIRLLKQIITESEIDESKWPAKSLAIIISRWKDRGLTPNQIRAGDIPDFADGKSLVLYKEYQRHLRTLNAADFDDLLLHNLTIFSEHADVLEKYHRQFRYILVDEYQDTNIAQYLWLRILASKHKNICCVGDDDQSIYGWRGAEVGNILKFEKDFPNAEVIRLEQNYRSTSNILSAASGLIAKNESRLGKVLWTDGNKGENVKLIKLWDDLEEARFVADEIESLQAKYKHPLSEIAILIRAGFQTRAFEEKFISNSIPYRVIGGLRFYERAEIKDVTAYLRLINQQDDNLAFERIINVPKRGIGPSAIGQIRDNARDNNLSFVNSVEDLLKKDQFKMKMKATFEQFIGNLNRWKSLSSELTVAELTDKVVKESGYIAMLQADKNVESQGRIENIKELLHALEEFDDLSAYLEHVSLVSDIDNMNNDSLVNIMTLHSAKGLEFATVFLAGWEEGLFPHQKSLSENGAKGLEEERRLAYVGITRAKERAYISFAANRRIYGQYQSSIPSRFIDELPSENIENVNLNNGFNFDSIISKKASPAPLYPSKTPSSSPMGFTVGERIFHQKFGYGKVKSIDGNHLEISFEKAGNKKVMDSFIEKI